MYDEALSTLEASDYNSDSFWLEGGYDSPFGVEEELDLVSIDRTASLIRDMSNKLDEEFSEVRDAAYNASQAIDKFIRLYNNVIKEY